MDSDLFRIVLLALAVLGLVGLGLAVATLMGIRRALEGSTEHSWIGSTQTDDSLAGTPHEEPADLVSTSQPEASDYQPAAVDATSAAVAQTPAAATEVAAGEAPDPAASIRSVLEQHGVGDPALAATLSQAAAAQLVEPQIDSAFAAHTDDPQEEPFQRDGRWWFKRGNELLLYDEASGEWLPVEGGVASVSGGGAPAAQPQSGATATQTASTPVVADQVATFWKCATCGAVNGSTAATCRMCFAARP